MGNMLKIRIKKWKMNVIKYALKKLPGILPLNPKKVCFLSDSRRTIGGNLGAIYNYLQGKDYKRILMLKPDRREKRGFIGQCRLLYTLVTSKYILLEDMVEITSYLCVREGQEVVQLWHGPGAFKRFGFSRWKSGERIGSIHTGYRKYTKAIVSAEEIKWCYSEAFSLDKNKIAATGFPRTDDFFDDSYIQGVCNKFYKKYPDFKRKKIILFAPTYRGVKVGEASYNYEEVDFDALYEAFHNEYIFLIKWHPMYYNNILYGKQSAPDLNKYQDFYYDFSDYGDINDLLLICDLLITDYSSVIFDYVLLNKPIIYFVYDLEEYTRHGGRGLYFDFEDYVYGRLANNSKELISAIQDAELMPDKRSKFINKFMSSCDGHSTEKTWEFIISNKNLDGTNAITAKNKILMSVIIPVYNAEQFLDQTILSVLTSKSEDLELIVIDDGSTDNSLDILKKYEKNYSNFYLLEQKNAGPSAARNLGLNKATGEFVFFLDSDDLLEVNVLREMCYKAIEQEADLVIASYDTFNEYQTFPVNFISKLCKKEEIAWNNRTLLWTFSLCNKTFRRSKIMELGLRFPDTNYSEDGVFVMDFVFHAEKIIGYDGIVFHYRRMTDAKDKSITSSVSEWKVQDYLRSHEMIYKMLEDRWLAASEGYSDFNELRLDDIQVNKYANEFLQKEINVLYNQFYKFFWDLDEKLIKLIAENMQMLFRRLDVTSYYSLSAKMPELTLMELPESYQQAKASAKVAVALFGTPDKTEKFIQCLSSLVLQRFVPYIVYIPDSMREFVEENIGIKQQLSYVKADELESFNQSVMERVTAEYILFADSDFVYEKSAIMELFKLAQKTQTDFITALVYLQKEDQAYACSAHGRMLLSVKNYRNGNKIIQMDNITGNKLFKTTFIKEMIFAGRRTMGDISSEIYKSGYFATTEKCYVIYTGSNERKLLSRLVRKIEKKEENSCDISLSSPRFTVDRSEIYKKLRTSKVKRSRWKRELIYKVGKLPLHNRVLFFSIRRDNELDDNLRVVEENYKGKKIVVSKMLPHSSLYKLKMYYYVATSKVIVTDDYIRYLRLFPLKKEQRVIQLWHACGAFKKFGLQGTTLSVGLEKATHIQYNLVSVSSESIREIYANAFDIDVSNVVALGVPRTDTYFDIDTIEAKKREVYNKYPKWKNKEILLYAPTFRDRGGDRTVFEPQIDFDKLSEQLLEDQLFIIAPHPVMTNTILPKRYENIIEIRDIHTMDLMFVSEQLITDYSSVIFEYCLLKKPIVFFCYDLEIYDRGFYLDYDETLPGPLIKKQSDLVSYLTSERRKQLGDNYEEFASRYMGACDGKSTQRVVDLITEYIKGGKGK